MPAIEQEIRKFIVENFLMGQEDHLKNDDSFLEKGIFDSTGILELVSFIENQYAVTLEPDELIPENLDSLAVLTRFLERKLAPQARLSEVSVSRSPAGSSL